MVWARTCTGHWALGDAYALPATPAAFHAAFAGFWFSHIPRACGSAFFHSLHAALPKGARVVLLDNRFVAGSSTPMRETDAAGDRWQLRPLADGSQHRVLKYFPAEAQLHAAVEAAGARAGTFTQCLYFWACSYLAPGSSVEGGRGL